MESFRKQKLEYVSKYNIIGKVKFKKPKILDFKYSLIYSSITVVLYFNTLNNQFTYDDR